jgi:cellobiose phosphorylase
VLASIMNNDPEYAYDIYKRMLPLNSSKRIDIYETEPYVYAEYITSPDHPTEGQASHSWLTGTAVWMLRIGIDHILGIQTSLQGITISPSIPSRWKKYSAERKFRGKTIKLNVLNPSGKNGEISRVVVNGIEKENAFIKPEDYKEDLINVEITL